MSTRRNIYLAGPIAGCNDEEANDWRNDVSQQFCKGITGISPLRCEPLVGETFQVGMDPLWSQPSGIYSKNMLDTKECDLVLAYLPKVINDRRPSYGTVIEIAWTIMLDKPLIIVTDDDYVKNHPLISHNVGWLLDNLDDAVKVINGLFADYVTPPSWES